MTTRLPTRDGAFDYQKYLASREWALLKREVRKRAFGICENCHRAPIEETHHKTYRRLGKERPEDLLGVCRTCHQYLSAYSDVNPAALCCTPEEAEEWADLLRDDPDLGPAAEAHAREIRDAWGR